MVCYLRGCPPRMMSHPPDTPSTPADELISHLPALMNSTFRRRFKLSEGDRQYIRRIGEERLAQHARDFVRERLAPAQPTRDGKQTPMKGHPIFKAQHACACCCRGCLQQWHGYPKGISLSPPQQEAIVCLLLTWVQQQLRLSPSTNQPSPTQGEFDF